jgi:hypothetical protein
LPTPGRFLYCAVNRWRNAMALTGLGFSCRPGAPFALVAGQG